MRASLFAHSRIRFVAPCAVTIALSVISVVQGRQTPPTVTGAALVPPDRFDISPALSTIPPVLTEGAGVAHPVRRIPIAPRPPAVGRAARPVDVSIQTSATASPAMLEPITGFNGVGGKLYRAKVAPSDINGAVGATQFVEWANEAFAVFDKQAAIKYGPADGKVIWKGFGGSCEDDNDGDPIVQYDKIANRWILTQFAVADGPPFHECIAVSSTADALGKYARYAYPFQNFNDYPKFGVWPDGYYATFNMFRGTNTFLGSKVCAFPRTAMMAGQQQAPAQCFDIARQGGLLPADLDGAKPPAAGSPAVLLNFGLDKLNIWTLRVNWTNAAQSTLVGPTTLAVPTFDPACGATGTCVTQPGGSQKLDSLSDRLMYRLAYRNFADHESLVVNHSVSVSGHAAVRWYEIRGIGTQPALFQVGTYAPDAAHRWMGSAAMDKMGNLLLGFSESSPTIFPSIRIAGRLATDPPHVLAAEFKAIDGKSAQAFNRWGDYASMSVDPTDDCTFWFTAQYLDKTVTPNWHTYVAKTRFKSCR